jgi:hypothetical protein
LASYRFNFCGNDHRVFHGDIFLMLCQEIEFALVSFGRQVLHAHAFAALARERHQSFPAVFTLVHDVDRYFVRARGIYLNGVVEF